MERGLVLVLAATLVSACSQPPTFVTEPELLMNPGGKTPLAGVVAFTSDQPARATLVIGDGASTTTVTPKDDFSTAAGSLIVANACRACTHEYTGQLRTCE